MQANPLLAVSVCVTNVCVSESCGRHSKSPWTGWLKTTKVYSPALEGGGLRSRCWPGWFLPETPSGENFFHASAPATLVTGFRAHPTLV